jgi:hypothetical protein
MVFRGGERNSFRHSSDYYKEDDSSRQEGYSWLSSVYHRPTEAGRIYETLRPSSPPGANVHFQSDGRRPGGHLKSAHQQWAGADRYFYNAASGPVRRDYQLASGPILHDRHAVYDHQQAAGGPHPDAGYAIYEDY